MIVIVPARVIIRMPRAERTTDHHIAQDDAPTQSRHQRRPAIGHIRRVDQLIYEFPPDPNPTKMRIMADAKAARSPTFPVPKLYA